ncbi:MAG TPA: DUF402 domain-containing protein [Caldilineae bacterium]|nr:DUF402 domain-containing protein [Caldilineae bacterium]
MGQSTILIHKADHNGHILVSYSGWLLDDSEHIVVLARWQRASMLLPYVTFGEGDLLVETFYRQRYYNIFALYDGSKAPDGMDWEIVVERLRLELRRNNTGVAALGQLCPTLSSVCPLKGHYVNFTYPVVYDAQTGVLIWRDLALDLWIPAEGRPLLLDAEEYGKLALAQQDPALHSTIQSALKRLWSQAVAHTGPFATNAEA